MSVMLSELYKALLAERPNEAQAQRAAEEVAAYERQIADVRSDLRLLISMVATLIALQIALGVGHLWLSFGILSRLPR